MKKRVPMRLDLYSGQLDPEQWLSSLLDATKRQRYSSPEEQDAHLCQAFAEHLQGEALTWFIQLRTESIKFFDDLAAAFLKQHLQFAVNDIVLRKSDSTTDRAGKFGFHWSGPFRIARVVKRGIYELEDNFGNTFNRTWNAIDLRRFHD
ncbi:unnamed protein product [Microthlaspi erraticum]|uniref:Retrotransposon gag domain-containing protein n=1 Tax=Microthlaspi erraticum TaxID=1685480 RepID=A0A6D2JMV5_9BRAS|nr:unnamed protein product [Microthlaspi erraticum]